MQPQCFEDFTGKVLKTRTLGMWGRGYPRLRLNPVVPTGLGGFSALSQHCASGLCWARLFRAYSALFVAVFPRMRWPTRCRRSAARLNFPVHPALTRRANVMSPLRGWIRAPVGILLRVATWSAGAKALTSVMRCTARLKVVP